MNILFPSFVFFFFGFGLIRNRGFSGGGNSLLMDSDNVVEIPPSPIHHQPKKLMKQKV